MKSSANIWSPLAEGQAVLPYSPGQLIYLQDTEAQVFYYIVSGTVRCFLSAPNGEERTLTLHHTGDLIGEAAFFDKQPRVSSAVAVTPCTLVSIDRPHLEEVFSKHPDMAVSMLEYLARTVRLLSAHVDSAFLQADRRLARYLLTLIPDENGVLSCTHEELGAAVGLSRVTVSRTLSKFAKDGLIRTGYRSLAILDRKALDLLSQ